MIRDSMLIPKDILKEELEVINTLMGFEYDSLKYFLEIEIKKWLVTFVNNN